MPRRMHLDEAQGAGEARTEVYLNTLKEYRSLQRRDSPRTTGAAGFAGRQGGGACGWYNERRPIRGAIIFSQYNLQGSPTMPLGSWPFGEGTHLS